jgi:hypothetical protein
MGFHDIHPLVSFNSPSDVWAENPSFLICEILFFVLLVLCTVHAIRSGPRHRW